jgi:hypothetical protein
MRFAYYITAHGYGHGVRSCDILSALLKGYPGVQVTVTTDLPESFLRNRVPYEGLTIRQGAFDVGMVQTDSIRVDVDATLEQALQLVEKRPALLRSEVEFLRELGADRVVVDIPSIPIGAAKQAGIPAVAVGNFSWDWIYSPFVERDPRWQSVVDLFEEGYRQADLLLKLPFSPAMAIFSKQVDIPLLAQPGPSRREDIAAMTGADLSKKWVLLSFTTLDWEKNALNEVEALTEYEFFTVKPLSWTGCRNIHSVDRAQVGFPSVLASADIVVTKPGFGILSECVVSGKPMIYAERENFIEYPLLERELKRVLRNAHLPASELYAGRLGPALVAIETAQAPSEILATGGAEKAVEILMSLV